MTKDRVLFTRIDRKLERRLRKLLAKRPEETMSALARRLVTDACDKEYSNGSGV